MSTRKRLDLAAAILSLFTAILACGTGYTTHYTSFPNKGQIVIKAESDEGDREIEVKIHEDYFWEQVTVMVAVEVQAGSYHAELIDDDGKVLSLDASAGNPANTSGEMTTDAFGNISLKSQAQDVQGLKIIIDYTRP